MSTEIDFSKNYSIDVNIVHDELGDLGTATLRFGADHWPHLKFKHWQNYALLGEAKKHRRLRATTDDGETFTLFDCLVVGFYLSIDYVVAGDVSGEFNAISIRFDDINEWFMPQRSVEDKLKRDPEVSGRLQQISVAVQTDTQSFNLTSDTVLRINYKGEDTVIHEHVRFKFERSDGQFFVKDIKEKSHELMTLFSILTAVPLYLVNVLVTSGDDLPSYAFFSSFKKKEQSSRDKGWNDYFTRRALLDGRWQDIFDRYYGSEYRKISWVRLSGMQRYDGFWEYRALGYVSLLDRYVSQRTSATKRKQSVGQDPKIEKIDASLSKIVPPITSDQRRAILSIVSQEYPQKEVKLSFRDKYDFVSSMMNTAIRSIINVSDQDFIKIKKIRDAVAHGDAPDIIEADYGRIGNIVSKIAITLTYWAFLDFGLTDDDFLNCMQSHCALLLRADIDRVMLARVKGTAGFFSISENQYDEISCIKDIKIHSCFIVHGDGRIEYAAHHTNSLREWFAAPGNGGVTPVEKLFGTAKDKVQCWGEAYLETQTRRLELVQPFFIQNI